MSSASTTESDTTASAISDPRQSTIKRVGWLEKKGSSTKNWKRRWFILTDSALQYYDGQRLKGSMHFDASLRIALLVQSGGLTGKSFKFYVSTTARELELVANSARDRGAWITDLVRVAKMHSSMGSFLVRLRSELEFGLFRKWEAAVYTPPEDSRGINTVSRKSGLQAADSQSRSVSGEQPHTTPLKLRAGDKMIVTREFEETQEDDDTPVMEVPVLPPAVVAGTPLAAMEPTPQAEVRKQPLSFLADEAVLEVGFHSFRHWQRTFEPEKLRSEKQKEEQREYKESHGPSYMDNVKQWMLDKIVAGVAASAAEQMSRLILETVATVLEECEKVLTRELQQLKLNEATPTDVTSSERSPDAAEERDQQNDIGYILGKGLSIAAKESLLPFIGAMRALVLSFRFATEANTPQIEFTRRLAINRMAESLRKIVLLLNGGAKAGQAVAKVFGSEAAHIASDTLKEKMSVGVNSDTDALIAELTKLKSADMPQRQQQRMIIRLAVANMHCGRSAEVHNDPMSSDVLHLEREQLRHMLRSLISAARISLESNPIMLDFTSQCLRILQQATAGGNKNNGLSGGNDGNSQRDEFDEIFGDIGDELSAVFGGVIEQFIETKVLVLEDYLVQQVSELSSVLGTLYDPASQNFLSTSITDTLSQTLRVAGDSCGRSDILTSELRESIFMNVSSCVSASCSLLSNSHASAASMSEVEDQLLEKITTGWAHVQEQLLNGLLRCIRAVLAFTGMGPIEKVAAEAAAQFEQQSSKER